MFPKALIWKGVLLVLGTLSVLEYYFLMSLMGLFSFIGSGASNILNNLSIDMVL